MELSENSLSEKVFNLREKASRFDISDETAFFQVVASDWPNFKEEVVALVAATISEVVTAQPFLLEACYKQILSKLSHKVSQQAPPASVIASVQNRVETVLRSLIEVTPLSRSMLCSVLAQVYPYQNRPVFVIEYFCRYAVQIMRSLELDTKSVWSSLINYALKLDVQVGRKTLAAALHRDDLLFELDDHVDSFSSTRSPILSPVLDLAEKLDRVMIVMVDETRRACIKKSGRVRKRAQDFVAQLTSLFLDLVVPTHGISHTQFLWFYLCSLSKDFCDLFVHELWTCFTRPTTPPVLRQSLVGYLSGVLSRARYVPMETVGDYIRCMADWLHSYVSLLDGRNTQGCVSQHAVFYSVCQGLFYTLVFHHRTLCEDTAGLAFVRQLNIERIVFCRLNPLKYCTSPVVDFFARITRRYEIAMCYSVIERNNRMAIPIVIQRGGTSQRVMPSELLDGHFPFDPCLLATLLTHIQSLYREWDGIDDSEILPRPRDKLTKDIDDLARSFGAEISLSLEDGSLIKNDIMCVSP